MALVECKSDCNFHCLSSQKFSTFIPDNKRWNISLITVRIPLARPHWKHSELFFEKKVLIPALPQLLTTTVWRRILDRFESLCWNWGDTNRLSKYQRKGFLKSFTFWTEWWAIRNSSRTSVWKEAVDTRSASGWVVGMVFVAVSAH